MDFQLARIDNGQSLEVSTAELGSLPYLAPECLGGPVDRPDARKLNPKADWDLATVSLST